MYIKKSDIQYKAFCVYKLIFDLSALIFFLTQVKWKIIILTFIHTCSVNFTPKQYFGCVVKNPNGKNNLFSCYTYFILKSSCRVDDGVYKIQTSYSSSVFYTNTVDIGHV